MAFQPGRLITPSLRLLRLLGEGGMGSVWVAEHLTLHTEVAVKCLGAELTDNPEARARFAREAAAAAQIKSAHVVQTLDHGFLDDGTPFIVMESSTARTSWSPRSPAPRTRSTRCEGHDGAHVQEPTAGLPGGAGAGRRAINAATTTQRATATTTQTG